jgi:RNA recognition motif-containing protein
MDGEFNSRCYGFVQFEALEAAQKAIKEMSGKALGEKKESDSPKRSDQESEDSDKKDDPFVLVVTEYVPK